jgi:hypothetical protein
MWLVVTSLEKLNVVVDSLESKQVELARAQARFPLRVDLLPSDIDEVTGKRVLDKTDDGQRAVREVQQLITHPEHGLGAAEVGTLITLDRSYELLEELIPTSWRAEVDQVASQYGPDSTEAQVIKVVALCVEVPALPLTADNTGCERPTTATSCSHQSRRTGSRPGAGSTSPKAHPFASAGYCSSKRCPASPSAMAERSRST